MKAMIVRFALFVLLNVAAIMAVMFASLRWKEHRLMEQSGPIQASLESYRVTHGHYPDALSRIGWSRRKKGRSITIVSLTYRICCGSERALASP
jgi:hypothetical protein